MDTIQVLKEYLPELYRQYPVCKIGVFGSFARGEASADSDIDLLIDFSKPVNLLSFVDIKLDLENLLQRKVDLVTVNALKPRIKDKILNEVVYL